MCDFEQGCVIHVEPFPLGLWNFGHVQESHVPESSYLFEARCSVPFLAGSCPHSCWLSSLLVLLYVSNLTRSIGGDLVYTCLAFVSICLALDLSMLSSFCEEYLPLGRCNLYPAPGSYENCAVEFGPTADVTCLSHRGGQPGSSRKSCNLWLWRL